MVIKHFHGYLEVVEASRINPPDLLVGNFLSHDQSMQLLSRRVLIDLHELGYKG